MYTYQLTKQQQLTIQKTQNIYASLINADTTQECILKSYPLAEYMRTILIPNDVERFCVVFFNNKIKIIGSEIISIGSINQAPVSIREVFRKALLNNATAIAVGHNHPSGELKPSDEDIELTRAIKEASNLINIKFLDHIIVNYDKILDYFSFVDAGYL